MEAEISLFFGLFLCIDSTTTTELRKSQCIVKIIFLCCLPAAIFQVRFFWPHENQDEHGLMLEKDRYDAKRNSVSYMSDELGLHRVENTSHSNGAVSLHLYSPPFASCQVCKLKSSSKISLTFLPYYFWNRSLMSERVKNLLHLWHFGANMVRKFPKIRRNELWWRPSKGRTSRTSVGAAAAKRMRKMSSL